MMISRNWLNEWVDIANVDSERILKTLNSIGLEVDSFNSVRIPKNIVVGYVKSRDKHPDADKLSVCQVDVGSETLQIVCGAKNVEAGQFVPVALIGAVMPSGLEIKKTKLRGVESSGMICSSTELGLVKVNDGILPLDESIGELKLGRELCEYSLLNDDIIEIDLTPNRGDCLSVYGIARDLSAALDLPLRDVSKYEEAENLLGIGRILTLRTEENIQSNLQYRAFELKEKFSENLLMKMRLAIIECSKQNCVERLLEYVTYSTGVIFNAYDYDKLKKDDGRVVFDIDKDAHSASKIMVGGENLGVAGIYQSDAAKIDDNSKIIVIEASYTNPEIIATTIYEDKKMPRFDYVYRSLRGSEPNINFGADYLFKMLAGSKSALIYAGSQQSILQKEPRVVSFTMSEMNRMIGQEVLKNDVVKILKKLGFEVNFNVEKDSANVKVPHFRHDIINAQDVCEEIVRIIGIDNIASKPLKFSEQNRINDTFVDYKNALNLRRKAASSGFFESVHYVFDDLNELNELGFKPCKVEIANPISNELNTLRPTLVNHLLKSAERNIKNSKKSVKIFEFGSVFDENGSQSERFGFVASGLVREPSLLNSAKPSEIGFLSFASAVRNAIGEFELKPSKDINYLSEFEQAEIYRNGVKVGYIGRVNVVVENRFDLPKTYLCEVDFGKLKFSSVAVKTYSKFPAISRDLSLIVPDDMKFEVIKECINALKIRCLKEFLPVDIYRDKNLGSNSSLTVKFVFQDIEKTLEDEEIALIMDKILDSLKKNLNIGVR
ncbi:MULTISPECIES: phenylalanine--tRNA ligase subunit beta [unclassified Campylobacter]|uniref:phenylalanine--tRNA ligase subunit beta n=1 Tax=unclassified Campylobacter TaxID=2593542 RepID=UPI0014758E2B|nr:MULTISPECIES: phenylalanine--tRNA ligase subunit beta [unclassified Campylobacter]